MNFVKNNKIFIFLCTVVIVCVSLLGFELLNNNATPSTPNNTNNNQASHTQIDDFKVDFNKQMQLTFNWNITLGKESIQTMEIYHKGELLKDVSDAASWSLDFLESKLQTGNEEFEFVVTLGNKQQIRKTAFIYLNEAFNFEVSENRTLGKVDYQVSYYYEKTHSVNAPKVSMKLNQNATLPLNFISSEKVDVLDGYVKVTCIYELDLASAKKGSYIIDYTWMFQEYNLEYKTTSSLEI